VAAGSAGNVGEGRTVVGVAVQLTGVQAEPIAEVLDRNQRQLAGLARPVERSTGGLVE